MLRSRGHRFEDRLAVLFGRCGRLKVPVQIGLLARVQLGSNYFQTGLSSQVLPSLSRQEPAVARIAPLFHAMEPLLGFRIIVGHGAINEQEMTAQP